MKKMIAVIAIFMIFFVGNNEESISLADYFDGELIIYTTEASELSVNLGFCYMNNDAVDAPVVGESIKVKDIELAHAIHTLDANIIKSEVLDDGTMVLYCHSDRIHTFVMVGQERVNLQIAQKGEYVILGWPLILGSF